ncbi:MAG: hypothetical protein N4A36_02665 [Candidatus Gracilibacteria bacterium]|jgi:hypothetical protein|nr:hypothetical protein [Candidatus Gracilibacteria bacterium]
MNNDILKIRVNHFIDGKLHDDKYANWFFMNGKKVYTERNVISLHVINNKYIIAELASDFLGSPTAPDSCLHCYDKDANLLWVAESPKYPDGTPALPNCYQFYFGQNDEHELVRYFNVAINNHQSFAGPHIPFDPREPDNLHCYIIDAKTGKVLYARDESYMLNGKFTGINNKLLYYWYSFKDERFVCFPRNFKFKGHYYVGDE